MAKDLGVPRFVNVQNDYSLLNRAVEADVVPVCERLDVVLMPYFPLASGVLTGKYRKGQAHPEGSRLAAWGPMADQFASDEKLDVVERLARVRRARTVTRCRSSRSRGSRARRRSAA